MNKVYSFSKKVVELVQNIKFDKEYRFNLIISILMMLGAILLIGISIINPAKHNPLLLAIITFPMTGISIIAAMKMYIQYIDDRNTYYDNNLKQHYIEVIVNDLNGAVSTTIDIANASNADVSNIDKLPNKRLITIDGTNANNDEFYHRTDLIEQFKNDGGLESGKYSWSRIEQKFIKIY